MIRILQQKNKIAIFLALLMFFQTLPTQAVNAAAYQAASYIEKISADSDSDTNGSINEQLDGGVFPGEDDGQTSDDGQSGNNGKEDDSDSDDQEPGEDNQNQEDSGSQDQDTKTDTDNEGEQPSEEELPELPPEEIIDDIAAGGFFDFQLPTDGLSPEALALASSARYYSALEEDDLDILLMELSLREDTMAICENFGFSIRESIPKAWIMQQLNVDLSGALTIIENHQGETAALEAVTEFRQRIYINPTLTEEETEPLLALFIEGRTVNELIRLCVMKLIFQTDLEDFIYAGNDYTLEALADIYMEVTGEEILPPTDVIEIPPEPLEPLPPDEEVIDCNDDEDDNDDNPDQESDGGEDDSQEQNQDDPNREENHETGNHGSDTGTGNESEPPASDKNEVTDGQEIYSPDDNEVILDQEPILPAASVFNQSFHIGAGNFYTPIDSTVLSDFNSFEGVGAEQPQKVENDSNLDIATDETGQNEGNIENPDTDSNKPGTDEPGEDSVSDDGAPLPNEEDETPDENKGTEDLEQPGIIPQEDLDNNSSFELSNNDLNIILNIAVQYSIDAKYLLLFMLDIHMPVDGLYECIRFVTEAHKLEIETTSPAFAGAMPDFRSHVEKNQDYPSAPFQYKSQGTEKVNINTGALTYIDPIINLQGRGGFDLDLSLKYDSSESNEDYYFMRTEYFSTFRYNGDYYQGVIPMNWAWLFKNQMRPNPRYIGAGWSFNSTSLYFPEYHFIEDPEFYLRTQDGGQFAVYADRNGFKIKDYELADLLVERDTNATFTDSAYVLTYHSGTKEYFSKRGNIVAQRDRFGNTITYVDNADGFIITDSLGRKITVTYAKSLITFTMPDNSTVKYTISNTRHPAGNTFRQLTKKEDQLGNITQFTYKVEASDFDFTHYLPLTKIARLDGEWFKYQDGKVLFTYRPDREAYYRHSYAKEHSQVYYNNLTKITYPTGMSANYTYRRIYGKLGSVGYKDFYVIRSRYDTVDGVQMNNASYTYDYRQNHTGYSLLFDQYGKEVKELPKDYTYTVIEQNGGNKITYLFNNKHQMTEKTTVNTSYTVKEGYTYNKNLITKVVRSYSGSKGNFSTTEQFRYDNYGNVITYWNTLADGGTDAEYRTQMAYGDFGLLSSKEYRQDKDTIIKETYTPTTDKKAIGEISVSVNGELKEKSQMTYSRYGNVTILRSYVNSSDYIEKRFSYNRHTYVTAETINGVGPKYAYDTMGYMTSATDPNGNVTKYTYDLLGRQTSVTYPDRNQASITFDDKNNLLTQVNELGAAMEYRYNQAGFIIAVNDVKSKKDIATFQYDNLGRITQTTDALGQKTTYTYDTANRLVEKAVSGVVTETFLYEDGYSRNGSRLIKTVKGTNGAPDIKFAVHIDKHGRTVSESAFNGSTEHKTQYTYDYLGNRLTDLTPQDLADKHKTTNTYTYDHRGNAVTVTNPAGYTYTTEYDWLGRKTGHTDPKGGKYEYLYNALGLLEEDRRPFDGSIKTVNKYTYDNNGNIISQEISSGLTGGEGNTRTQTFTYNNRNRLIQSEMDGLTTKYDYDAVGNTVKMTTGGIQHTLYDYDHLGRLIKVTDPLGQTETYQYNANGNLTRKTDRNGSVIRSTYDAFGHCISVRGTGADQIEDGFMKYQYSANGLLLYAENNNLSTTYQYDSAGRVIKETDSDGAVRQYSYDRNGNRTSFTLTVNGRRTIQNTYVYDRLNRLSIVSDLGKELARYGYDENGNRSALTYVNGVATAYTFNAGNMVTELHNQINGSTLSKYSYSYYLDGNQARITDHEGIVTRYQYDGAGRLFEEIRSAGADNIITKTYTYDGFGNRSSLTVSDNGQLVKTLYKYDANNRLLLETATDADTRSQFITSYGYDPNGNQTSKTHERLETPANGDKPALSMTLLNNTQDNPYGNLQNSLSGVYSDQDENTIPSLSVSLVSPKQSNANLYQYDVFNRMTCATLGGVTAAYSYKHDGLRISKEVDGQMTKHLWDGSQVVLELDENGQTIDRYIRGIHLIYSDKNLYYLYNAHGDTVQLTDTLGTVFRDYAYDAFGNGLDYSLYDSNPFRYAGEYLDFESGNIYLRNRYYDPATSRMLSEDPIRAGLNWYTYCDNNPVAFIDPFGLERVVVSGGIYSQSKKDNKGYYYEFIDTAIAQMNIWMQNKNIHEEGIAWLISTEGWSRSDIRAYQSYANENPIVKVVMFSTTDELIDYINYQSISDTSSRSARLDDPITHFSLFSHGLAQDGGTINLGFTYSSDNANLVLNKSHLGSIYADSFNSPVSTFYSCNTGTAGGASFAQLWVDVFGGYASAYSGQSYYGGVPDQSAYYGTFRTVWSKPNSQGGIIGTGIYPIGGKVSLPVAGSNAREIRFYPSGIH